MGQITLGRSCAGAAPSWPIHAPPTHFSHCGGTILLDVVSWGSGGSDWKVSPAVLELHGPAPAA